MNKTSSIVVLVIGALILLLSAFAGNIGLADVPGLGPQQMIGVIVGLVVLVVGAFLNQNAGRTSSIAVGGTDGDNDKGWLDSLTKAEEVGNTQVDDSDRKG